MSLVNGKSILVTGATGSFGKRFVKAILNDYDPKRIIAFSRDELKQFEMQQSIHSPKLRYFLGDVRDKERLYRAIDGVEIMITHDDAFNTAEFKTHYTIQPAAYWRNSTKYIAETGGKPVSNRTASGKSLMDTMPTGVSQKVSSPLAGGAPERGAGAPLVGMRP